MNQQQGIFAKAFVYLFGANWKTSLTGYVTLLCYFIHGHPQCVHWITEPWQGLIWEWSEYVFLGGFLAFAKQVKDKNVTGGNKQQTFSGATADSGQQTLVDETLRATVASGESVTPDQQRIVKSL